ncbi:hypothetical protein LTX14_000803 [Clostridium perfringens]|uniref:DUF5677 domain-containing protein n=1 Tax=Clostridium perfringens TaxID=1502 RepID=UPI0013E4076F|nr:DUF5677 domain-containing protein [Clostridium perfringens]MBI6022839.1 hypothetical protein [Clostridium perfringens]MBI6043631.1 hypothetical protein [Clostridium perfringens]MBI6046051.1 hypothetical protein [Clostridium perfringens]MDJ8925867.1 DUF5677 domain-containing protein [Clostridium perfringens]MDJ8928696.1 DUF5677 domain-containing protein [Clostridium perfringens]
MDNLEELQEEIFKFYNRDNKDNLDTWIDVFNLLDVFNLYFYNYTNHIKNKLNTDSEFNDVLQKSLGRILKTFNEILVLLKNGFPEGALARWRTLYETIIIIMLIIKSKNRELMAKDYVDYQKKIDMKNLRKYIEISEIEGSSWEKVNIDKSLLEDEEKGVKDYSWSGFTTFAQIQNQVSPKDYKIHYSTANWCIHSGNYKSLCLLEDSIGSSSLSSIRTKYWIDEVIGATLEILMFFFNSLKDNLFKSEDILNEDYIVLLKVNNLIVDKIINIRKEVYDYGE